MSVTTRPRTARLLFFLLALLAPRLPTVAHAFPLSALSSSDFIYADTIIVRHFRDHTVFLPLLCTQPLPQLSLHPDVMRPSRPAPGPEYWVLLLVRLNPSNGNVVWARALNDATLQYGADVDANGNIFLFINDDTSRRHVLRKISPSGQHLWQSVFPYDRAGPGGAHLSFGPLRLALPDSLLVPATLPARPGIPAVATLTASSGAWKLTTTLPPPPSATAGALPATHLEALDATTHMACALTRPLAPSGLSRDHLFVHCFRHSRSGFLRARDVQLGPGASLFRASLAVADGQPAAGAGAGAGAGSAVGQRVFVAYERVLPVSALEEPGVAKRHELVVHEWKIKSLRDGGVEGGVRTALRLPKTSSVSSTLSSVGVQYVPKRRSLSVLFVSEALFTGVVTPGASGASGGKEYALGVRTRTDHDDQPWLVQVGSGGGAGAARPTVRQVRLQEHCKVPAARETYLYGNYPLGDMSFDVARGGRSLVALVATLDAVEGGPWNGHYFFACRVPLG